MPSARVHAGGGRLIVNDRPDSRGCGATASTSARRHECGGRPARGRPGAIVGVSTHDEAQPRGAPRRELHAVGRFTHGDEGNQ
jgi:hypothetical protein